MFPDFNVIMLPEVRVLMFPDFNVVFSRFQFGLAPEFYVEMFPDFNEYCDSMMNVVYFACLFTS